MITAFSAAGAANGIATTPGAATPAKDSAESTLTNADFETFLRMLTAQLKNQDPMNPMEGSDFAVQLATFSGVEQQTHTNKLLSELTAQMGGDLNRLANWIGKEGRTTSPVYFGDKPLTLDIQPHAQADGVVLVTLDAKGREVTREEIGTGKGQVEWMGRDALGGKLPDGAYMFRIESWKDEKVIAEDNVAAYGRIVEAETTPTGVQLVLEGGGTVMADKVEALRDPR